MKTPGKACRGYLLALAVMAAVLFAFQEKADAATANEKTTYTFLTDTMGVTPAAACGIMSNIKCESGFKANIYGLGGAYGICQWTGVRLGRLRNWCGSKGYSASSLKGQLYFLQYELKTYYPTVYRYMTSVANTSKGAYNAGFYWCYYFEIPASRYSTSVYRGNLAQSTYWKSLGSASTYVSASAVGNGIKLTWNATSKYGYVVKRAVKSSGDYQTIASISSGTKKTYTDKEVTVGKTYYYYVQPLDSGGKELERSNKTSLKVQPSMQDKECSITLSKTEYTYNGKAKKPKVTVRYNGTKLKLNTDYTISYRDNIKAGTALVLVTGKGDYTGLSKLSFTIKKAVQEITASPVKTALGKSPVVLKASASGKGKITYSCADTKIAEVKSGRLVLKKAGVTEITVKAAATTNYKAATVKVKLTVTPNAPVVTALTAKKDGKVKVTWKKGKALSGYQIQYTRASNFKSGVTSLLVEKGTAVSATVKKLKTGKTYRFRVRSYVTAGSKKIYGPWSAVKTVVTSNQ